MAAHKSDLLFQNITKLFQIPCYNMVFISLGIYIYSQVFNSNIEPINGD